MSYAGLDLSLTSPGICWIPSYWMADPGACRVTHLEYKHTPTTDNERADRLEEVARRVISTARRLASRPIVCWGIESLPTHDAFAVGKLAELHGVVKVALNRMKQRIVVVPQSSARKLLMGKLPRKNQKKMVFETVASLMPRWSSDEVDAFVVANWLASEFGERCLAGGT